MTEHRAASSFAGPRNPARARLGPLTFRYYCHRRLCLVPNWRAGWLGLIGQAASAGHSPRDNCIEPDGVVLRFPWSRLPDSVHLAIVIRPPPHARPTRLSRHPALTPDRPYRRASSSARPPAPGSSTDANQACRAYYRRRSSPRRSPTHPPSGPDPYQCSSARASPSGLRQLANRGRIVDRSRAACPRPLLEPSAIRYHARLR